MLLTDFSDPSYVDDEIFRHPHVFVLRHAPLFYMQLDGLRGTGSLVRNYFNKSKVTQNFVSMTTNNDLLSFLLQITIVIRF
jgi:hypothetical protein